MKIALVGSSGGHLTHLYLLKKFWENEDRFWVTFDKTDAKSILKEERFYPCYYPTNRNVKNTIKNTILAFKILRKEKPDLIITTGGTGLSMRDVTPEATLKVATRNVPGISEAIRYESMKYTNRAMLSRGVSVLRNKTLIINLPGSLKAVKESLDIIIDPLIHGLEILKGEAHDCARKDG